MPETSGTFMGSCLSSCAVDLERGGGLFVFLCETEVAELADSGGRMILHRPTAAGYV
jgi:hypothetical protein